MSFSDIWNSFFADPIMELYKFQCASTCYTYAATSDTPILFDNLLYAPEYIVRTGLHYSADYAKDTLTVTIPASNAVAGLFMEGTPEHILRLTICRGGLKAEDFSPVWVGVVNGASFDFSSETYTCDLACETVASRMERFGLARCYQLSCPHTLYSTRCGVTQSHFATIRHVLSINDFTVTVDGEALPDGYFTAGQIVRQDGSRRFIASSTGNAFTLERSLALSTGDTVTLYPGCDKARTTCVSKFGNGPNYGGFPWMPLTSPFTSTIG